VLHPAGCEQLQPSGLGGGDRLQRRPEAHAAPGLDLADHEDRAVAEDQVDLTGVAAPVAVEHDHALLDQVPGGDRLAVRPE